MEGKILGIPLILIVLSFLIALMIDIPMIALHSATQSELRAIERQVDNKVTVTPRTTATPSATLSVSPVVTVIPTKGVTTQSGTLRTVSPTVAPTR